MRITGLRNVIKIRLEHCKMLFCALWVEVKNTKKTIDDTCLQDRIY